MRTSPEIVIRPRPQIHPLKDERRDDWTPQRLGDRKLVELKHRLDRIHALGDAFAHVQLSDDAQTRLAEIVIPQHPGSSGTGGRDHGG